MKWIYGHQLEQNHSDIPFALEMLWLCAPVVISIGDVQSDRDYMEQAEGFFSIGQSV